MEVFLWQINLKKLELRMIRLSNQTYGLWTASYVYRDMWLFKRSQKKYEANTLILGFKLLSIDIRIEKLIMDYLLKLNWSQWCSIITRSICSTFQYYFNNLEELKGKLSQRKKFTSIGRFIETNVVTSRTNKVNTVLHCGSRVYCPSWLSLKYWRVNHKSFRS